AARPLAEGGVEGEGVGRPGRDDVGDGDEGVVPVVVPGEEGGGLAGGVGVDEGVEEVALGAGGVAGQPGVAGGGLGGLGGAAAALGLVAGGGERGLRLLEGGLGAVGGGLGR